jgi:hypothetical protein
VRLPSPRGWIALRVRIVHALASLWQAAHPALLRSYVKKQLCQLIGQPKLFRDPTLPSRKGSDGQGRRLYSTQPLRDLLPGIADE